MLEPEVAMRRAWRALVERSDRATDLQSVSVDIIDDLVRRYAEPHRRYHTATHILWVLRRIDDLLAASDSGVGNNTDRDVMVAAALFHDAIYDVRPSADHKSEGSSELTTAELSNEARSGRLAQMQLSRLGWDQLRLDEVVALIEATETHVAASAAAAMLLDADLAVLGTNATDYQTYVEAIRAEYDFIDDQQWRVGRAAVLRSFLARPSIFVTPTFAGERERAARVNLADELARLDQTLEPARVASGAAAVAARWRPLHNLLSRRKRGVKNVGSSV